MGYGYIVACSRLSACAGERKGNEACTRTKERTLQVPRQFSNRSWTAQDILSIARHKSPWKRPLLTKMATEGTKALGFLYIAIEDEFISLCVYRLLSVFPRFFIAKKRRNSLETNHLIYVCFKTAIHILSAPLLTWVFYRKQYSNI